MSWVFHHVCFTPVVTMTNICMNDSVFDPCRMVSLVSAEKAKISHVSNVTGVRLILRHQFSRREYPFLCYSVPEEGMKVISDYAVQADLKGLKVQHNNRGQAFWQKYIYPDGWVTARYLFPDEQDAYEAAVVMSADFPTFDALI